MISFDLRAAFPNVLTASEGRCIFFYKIGTLIPKPRSRTAVVFGIVRHRKGIEVSKKEKKNSAHINEIELIENYMPASSSGDCTGLIPADGNPSREEFKNYKEIYPFAVPKMPDKNSDQKDMEEAERLNRN